MQINADTVIVLTGASSGVGKAIALALAPFGPHLFLAARREHALNETAEECRLLGATVHVVVTDTQNHHSIKALASQAASANGEIDVWINNAGVLAAGELDRVPAEVNEGVIRTNLLGYIHGAQQSVKQFKKQGYGILINNISIGGWLPTPYATAYSASKFGLRGFSAALKGELAQYPNIHVVDLIPSFLDTPGIQHAANYSGKALQPAPPVTDPQVVARAVVRLIEKPQQRQTIGLSSALLQASYALMPTFTRNLTGRIIRKYLQEAKEIAPTSGNVLGPVDYGTSIDGGWRASPLLRMWWIPVALATAAGAAVLVRKRMS